MTIDLITTVLGPTGIFFVKLFETSMLPWYLTARGVSSKYLLCVLRLNSLKYQEQRLEALDDHLEQRLVALISAPPQEFFDGLVHTSALSARLLRSWRPRLINLHLRASAYDKLLKKVGFEEKNLGEGDLLFFTFDSFLLFLTCSWMRLGSSQYTASGTLSLHR